MLRFLLAISLFVSLTGCKDEAPASAPTASPTSPAPAAAAPPEPAEGPGIPGVEMTYRINEYVGPIGALTHADDLPFLLGAEKVRRGDVATGGGPPVPAVVAYEGQPEELIYMDPEILDFLDQKYITLRGVNSAWRHADSDLRHGMTLAEVERINGKPFTVISFDMSQYGTILDWNGGALEGLNGRFTGRNINRDLVPEELKADELSSDLPALRDLGLRLSAITINIPRSTMTPTADFAVVPDSRLGPLTKEMGAEELLGMYQKSNVKSATIDMGSGLELPGYHLFPGTPNEVHVTYPDPENGEEYTTYTIVNPGGDWHLAGTDIRVGSTMAEVETANGGPFVILDGSQEGAGEVVNWNGGRLSGASLRLAVPEPNYLSVRSDEETPEISSTDPRLKNMNLTVSEITLSWK